MAAIESLCSLMKINFRGLSKVEHIALEAELFRHVCLELKNYFKEQNKDYFELMNFTVEMEGNMLENNFTKLILKDILLTQEYTLEGLANYTGVHIDILHDVICGLNINPSAALLQRAIDLHRTVRSGFYHCIIQKVIAEYNKNTLGPDTSFYQK
jgi:hypothetical protein